MENRQNLLAYYQKIYPVDMIFQFLTDNPNREFSVTLSNNIYIRSLSFAGAQEFKMFLEKKVPEKIDFGAVYTSRPQQGAEMIPLKKELVFDIDLTDYSRECCIGKSICNICLEIIKCAGQTMEYILRVYFGYKKILFVFSGGRGLHIWVSDKEAMAMDDKERRCLTETINNVKKEFRGKYFYNNILNEDILNILWSYENKFNKNDKKIDKSDLINKWYVKIDKNVSNDVKHLLKGPFSVHPTSKMISVPLGLTNLISIKMDDFPTLEDVVTGRKNINFFLNCFTEYLQRI